MTTSVGVIAWALFTGFIENSYGQLTFAASDLIRMAVFAAATRHARRRHTQSPTG